LEQRISYEGRAYMGMIFPLGNMPMLVVKAKKGYVACSYVDRQTAEHLGDVAAFVTGVKSFEDMFHAKIRHMTAWAEDMGVREGMSVKKALELMDQ
jgi:uncharacterized protein YunC (DUF1805 family)